MNQPGLIDRVALEKLSPENFSALSTRLDRHANRLQQIEEVLGVVGGPTPDENGAGMLAVGAQLVDTQGPRLDRIENTLAELAGTITNLVKFLSTPNKFELASAGPDPATQGLPSPAQPASPAPPAPRRGRGRPSNSKTVKASSGRRKA